MCGFSVPRRERSCVTDASCISRRRDTDRCRNGDRHRGVLGGVKFSALSHFRRWAGRCSADEDAVEQENSTDVYSPGGMADSRMTRPRNCPVKVPYTDADAALRQAPTHRLEKQ